MFEHNQHASSDASCQRACYKYRQMTALLKHKQMKFVYCPVDTETDVVT